MSFSISGFTERGLEILRVQDESVGFGVDIVPAFGAMLHGFWIRGPQGMVNLLESYGGLEELKSQIENSYRGVKLSPYVCRIRHGIYDFGGRSFRLEKRNPRGEALHGLLFDRPFEVLETVSAEDRAEALLRTCYGGEDPGFPFVFNCEVRFILLRPNRLHLTTRIINRADTPMPLADGWHPYFRTGSQVDQLELEFPVKGTLEFDRDLIPTGRILPAGPSIHLNPIGARPWDQSFFLDFTQEPTVCKLRDRARDLSILLTPGPGYPILNVYIPPSRSSIALEPLSGAPDAFNNKIGLLVLDAGARADFSFEIQGIYGNQ